MVLGSKLIGSIATAALLGLSAAHPGEHHDHAAVEQAVQKRDLLAKHTRRSLDKCSQTTEHQALTKRNIARRANQLDKLRRTRGVEAKQPQKYRRDLATLQEFETVSHNQTGNEGYSFDAGSDFLFSANTSCVLTPEITDGPYYVTGELIRQNVKEYLFSDGVDIHLEVQYIDIETCEPVPDVAVDIWGANATGVYSGISVSGNYAADGYNSTFLRGIQFTDEDGVVAFDTIFPGHYDGRATHTHLLAHMNYSIFDNQTINADNNITHIGQLFWDEDIRSDVEATYPYNLNEQAVTSNDEDMWSIVQADSYYDPFPQYVYLSDDVSDGILAWIQIGVNTSANHIDDEYYSVAAYIDAEGGHVNTASTFGGGGDGGMGGGDGNGTMNGTAPDMPTSSSA